MFFILAQPINPIDQRHLSCPDTHSDGDFCARPARLEEVEAHADISEYEQKPETATKQISTPETFAQEARERAILAPSYFGAIPETPDETNVNHISLGATTVYLSPVVANATPAIAQSAHVSDLLAKLDVDKLRGLAAIPGIGIGGGALAQYQGQGQGQSQGVGAGYYGGGAAGVGGGYHPPAGYGYAPAPAPIPTAAPGGAAQMHGQGYGGVGSMPQGYGYQPDPPLSGPGPAVGWGGGGGGGGGYDRERERERTWGGQALPSREFPGVNSSGGGGGGGRGRGEKTVLCKFWEKKG